MQLSHIEECYPDCCEHIQNKAKSFRCSCVEVQECRYQKRCIKVPVLNRGVKESLDMCCIFVRFILLLDCCFVEIGICINFIYALLALLSLGVGILVLPLSLSLGRLIFFDGIEFVLAHFEYSHDHEQDAVDEKEEDESSLHILSLRHF